MANNQTLFFLHLILTFFILFLSHLSNFGNALNSLKDCGFDSVYQLGDSISDTGNDILENPNCACSRPPYGESFFNKPTGRCSNGLLMIDYIENELRITEPEISAEEPVEKWVNRRLEWLKRWNPEPDEDRTGPDRMKTKPVERHVVCFSGVRTTCRWSRLPQQLARVSACVSGEARGTPVSLNKARVSAWRALSAGLPFLDPYLNKNGSINIGKGKNFAVSGSTALSSHALALKNLTNPFTKTSLTDQLSWMTSHFNSLCLDIEDCVQKFKNSLFIVGEIGGNDYNYALLREKSNFKEVMDMVPEVVQAIKDAIKKVIAYGAVRVIVSGNLPIGCIPLYLSIFKTNISWGNYDEYQCLVELNEFSIYHNKQLKQAIEESKKQHPSVTIVYGDYYNAFMWLLQNAPSLGFKAENLVKACWEHKLLGEKGFRFQKNNEDYSDDEQVCSNPDEYISFDGLHLTQNAYKHMSTWIIRDILPKLHCGKYAELVKSSSEISYFDPVVSL